MRVWMRPFPVPRVLLLLAALCALGACSSSSTPPDASADSGVLDTGTGDSGARDTGARDTSPPDTGARDSGTLDGGEADPGWVPMPGLPDGCVFERAEHPERVFTPEWRTEPSCGPGCDYLAPPPAGMLRAYDPRIAWYADGHGYFYGVQGHQGSDLNEVFLASTDGPAIAAWRYPLGPGRIAGCAVSAVGYGAGDAAFVIDSRGGDLPYREYIYRAPLAEIGQVTEPMHVLDETDIVPGSSNGTSILLVSPRWVVAVLTPGDYYLFLDADTRLKVGGPGAPVRAGPPVALLGDEDLYWEDWSSGARVALGDSTGNEHYVLSRLPDAEIIGTSILPSRWAWLQAYDRLPSSSGWSRYELWTGPWPAAGEPMTGHKVTDVSKYNGGVGSEHTYAQLMADAGGVNRHIELWDLADGRHRVFDPPGGTASIGWGVLDNPSYITDSEMLVSAGNFDIGPSGPRTLVRVQLDALPTVTP